MVVPLSKFYVDMIKNFRIDCQTLIDKFNETRTEDFREFASLWKAHKFYLIYDKYSKVILNFDFKEDSLQIAKSIMLNDHFVGGMFLLYGLYYIQEDPKASIRLELAEFMKLVKLLREERMSPLETCQSGYLFAKLLKHHAFAFVSFARDYTMENHNRNRLIHSEVSSSSFLKEDNTVNAKDWLRRFVTKGDFLDDLKKVEMEYYKKKQKLKTEHPELNLALDMVPDDLISDIERSLMQEDYTVDKHDPDIGTKRRKLKRRRMVIRHRCENPEKIDEEPHLDESSTKKPKGPQRGQRKLYFRTMINEAESEDESVQNDIEEPKLDLPEI